MLPITYWYFVVTEEIPMTFPETENFTEIKSIFLGIQNLELLYLMSTSSLYTEEFLQQQCAFNLHVEKPIIIDHFG